VSISEEQAVPASYQQQLRQPTPLREQSPGHRKQEPTSRYKSSTRTLIEPALLRAWQHSRGCLPHIDIDTHTSVGTQQFPSKSFPIHYSPITLLFGAAVWDSENEWRMKQRGERSVISPIAASLYRFFPITFFRAADGKSRTSCVIPNCGAESKTLGAECLLGGRDSHEKCQSSAERHGTYSCSAAVAAATADCCLRGICRWGHSRSRRERLIGIHTEIGHFITVSILTYFPVVYSHVSEIHLSLRVFKQKYSQCLHLFFFNLCYTQCPSHQPLYNHREILSKGWKNFNKIPVYGIRPRVDHFRLYTLGISGLIYWRDLFKK
jgi:hypothetical protein